MEFLSNVYRVFLYPSSEAYASTSPARGEVLNSTPHQAMRIMVQIKATLVLKKILVYIEVHEFFE